MRWCAHVRKSTNCNITMTVVGIVRFVSLRVLLFHHNVSAMVNKPHLRLFASVATVLLFACVHASSYTTYLIGRKTLPGCDFGKGNTCAVKVDMPGPPEEGAEFVGVVDIDYSTASTVSSNVRVALPRDPLQFQQAYGIVVKAVWYTTDGSPCPIPSTP